MSYWYLATPYSKYPGGIDAAYAAAVEQSGILIRAGLIVYSPIVHCHPIFKAGFVGSGDHNTWAAFDLAMITASCGVIVCALDGWKDSSGIKHEIELCERLGKPLIMMAPGIVPQTAP